MKEKVCVLIAQLLAKLIKNIFAQNNANSRIEKCNYSSDKSAYDIFINMHITRLTPYKRPGSTCKDFAKYVILIAIFLTKFRATEFR